MPAFTIGNRALHYRDEGPRDGPALVFSNSLGTDFRIWDPMIAHLPPGFRILRYDTAGHGLSDHAGAQSIEAHANDLIALMDHVGIGQASLIGLSVGGLIAQAVGKAAPQRLSKIVFCDTAHKIGTDDIWNDRIAMIERDGMQAVLDATLERWFTSAFRETAPDFALWRAMLLRTPVAGYCDLGRAIRDADFTGDCGALDIEALCICGADDGSTPPALMQDFAARLPRARYIELDACGHIPCVEQPARLAQEIAAFAATP